MTAHRCQARQYSDQMICHACGLVWDMNDPDPPECQKGEESSKPPAVESEPKPRAFWRFGWGKSERKASDS